MNILNPGLPFPSVEEADADGLLAVGGELTVSRLLSAYRSGIFPWYDSSQPILWWSPDPRMVLFPEKLKVSKSMRQLLRKQAFEVTFNQNFEEVIHACASINREGQGGTWITPEMSNAYIQLHRDGHACSVEVWKNKELVGGLYGVFLKEKGIFCGESMFSRASNASKYGFIKWVQHLRGEGVKLIDCQLHTPHLESLGAEEIPRQEFLKHL